MTDGARLVERAYVTFLAGRDVDAALEFFTDDAEWHPVTPHPTRGSSIPIRLYWQDSGEFLDGDGGEWQVLDQRVHEHGPFVLSYVRSSHGEGLMVYRIVDRKIADIWAINADGRAATGVF